MRPILVGCNHKTAPLELREKLSFDEPLARRAMDQLHQRFEGCEVVILSTCNRSEIYVARPTHGRPRRRDLIDFLADLRTVPADELAEHVYVREGRAAVAHLFRVASSLDSMVVGETQIVSQVKQALALADAHGSAGKVLRTVFQWALHVAKEVHTETGIASGRVSVGSVAVEFARQIFSRFEDKTVLLVGAGEMGKLTLRHVLETSPKRVLIANRTLARAEGLATRFSAEAHGFDRLDECLALADIVICSTGSAEPVLTRERVASVQARREYGRLLIVDIAVPRDVEPTVGEVDGVYVYNIDDLQAVVDAGVEDRQSQIADVDRIIAEHVDEFVQWRDARSVGPLLKSLRDRLSQLTAAEIEWAKPKLSGDPQRDAEVFEQLTHRVIGKLMHGPSRVLNEKVHDGNVEVYAETLRRMFDLPETDEDTPERSQDE
jgi:glutamyl-tRNA reductase